MSILAPIAVHVLAVLAATTAVFVLARMSGHSLVGTQGQASSAGEENRTATT
jgi:hypothetical protein